MLTTAPKNNSLINALAYFHLKHFVFFKYNVSTFFFLVNKTAFNVLFYSFFINHLIKKETYYLNYSNQTNKMLQIKKNHYFHFKKFRAHKRRFNKKKYIFTRFLKYNKFVRYTILNNFKLNNFSKRNFFFNNFNNSRFSPTNFFFMKKIIHRNWKFLIGNLISPFYWNFLMQKKWMRKKFVFSLILNKSKYYKRNRMLLYIRKKYNILNNKTFIRKLYVHNFFYLNRAKLRVKDLNYFIRIKMTKIKKSNLDKRVTRPYLFLNKRVRKKRVFANSMIIAMYRKYTKIFIYIKRTRFKFWKFRATMFKKFNFQKKKLFKIKLRKSYIRLHRIRKHSNCFYFKNLQTTLNFNKPISRKRVSKITIARRFFFLRSKFLIKMLWFLFLRTKIRTNYKIRHKLRYRNLFSPTSKLKLNYKNKKKNKFRFLLPRLKFNNIFKLQKYKLTKINRKLSYFCLTRVRKKLKRIAVLSSLNFFKLNFTKFKWTKISFSSFIRCPDYNFNRLPYESTLSTINNKYKWNICKTKKLILSFNAFFCFDKIKIKFKNYKKNFSFRTSFIYKKMKYPVIVSKKKTLFSLNKYGFMYLSEFLFKNIFFDQTLCNLKKKLYSFSYKNEFQRYVLKRFIRRHSILNLLSAPNKKTPLTRQTSLRWKMNDDKIWDDVNIKRIRFKPGYMTLWRDARQVLKLSLNLKMRYQYKLTSYLAKYNKFIKIKTFLMFELQLGNVLLKTRLLPDMNSTNLFIEHCLVFVNGMVCNNASFQIFTGDFIQLVVSLKYYILYKWFLNWEFKKVLRLRHIAKKKLIVRQNADEKTRSHLLPKWILFSKNSFSDVSKYLEIDYFTLSIFILYEPFQWSDVNPFTFTDTKFGVINLYNWKYIT